MSTGCPFSCSCSAKTLFSGTFFLCLLLVFLLGGQQQKSRVQVKCYDFLARFEVSKDPELLEPKLWWPAKSALSFALWEEITTYISCCFPSCFLLWHFKHYTVLSTPCAPQQTSWGKRSVKSFVLNKWRQEEHNTLETLINKQRPYPNICL